MSFHPLQALAAMCLLTVSLHSLASVQQGTTFGATADAGVGMADYSHTMSFHWDLPQGWTYTSACGRFSPAPAPAP